MPRLYSVSFTHKTDQGSITPRYLPTPTTIIVRMACKGGRGATGAVYRRIKYILKMHDLRSVKLERFKSSTKMSIEIVVIKSAYQVIKMQYFCIIYF